MRILLSIDTDKSLEKLSKSLLSIFNSFEKSALFIDLFHVYDKPSVKGANVPKTMASLIEREKTERIEFLADCERRIEIVIKELSNKKTLVNAYLEEGKYLKKLEEQMKRYQYDLLILLPRKKDPLEIMVNGRNTQKIFPKVSTPILILPKEKDLQHTQTKFIWCLETPKLSDLSPNCKYFIKMINEENLEFMHFCKKTPTSKSGKVSVVQTSDPHKAMQEFDNDRDKNYVYIFNPKKRTGLKKIIEKSFTKSLLKDPEFSLLLI